MAAARRLNEPISSDFAHYTRGVDDGLHYSLLLPSEEEFRATFGPEGAYGPVHLWMRCLGSVVRAFFHLEVLSDGNTTPHGDSHEKLYAQRLVFAVNGVPINSTVVTGIGGEFTLDLDQLGDVGELEITVAQWKRYAKFAAAWCEPQELLSRKEPDPGLIMHVYTLDGSSHSPGLDSGDVGAIARHLLYHTCMLNLLRYEIVVQRDYIPLMLQHPVVSHGVASGLVFFLIKGDSPPQQLGRSYKWQALYYNLAVLQHWNENVRLLFWDSDEFLVSPPVMLPVLRRKLLEFDVINLQRKSVVCAAGGDRSNGDGGKDCSGPEREFDFATTRYVQSDVHLATKIVLNPSFAGCVLVHFALCPAGSKGEAGRHRLDSRIAYLAHMENFHALRKKSGDQSYKWYPTELGKQLGACEPQGTGAASGGNWTIQQAQHMHSSISAAAQQWHSDRMASFYFQYEVGVLVVSALSLLGMAVCVLACVLGLCRCKRNAGGTSEGDEKEEGQQRPALRTRFVVERSLWSVSGPHVNIP